MTALTSDVPESLATKEAQKAGLLAPDAIEAMLREGLRRRAADEFLQAADKLAAAKTPPMTMEEIQAEVAAVRARQQ